MERKKKFALGFVWSFLENFGTQAVSLVVSIILARLIMPEEFGIISATTIFTSVANTFVSGGWGSALVQKKNVDELDYSSLFIFNSVFSVCLYGVIFFTAPKLVHLLSASFDYDLLCKVIRILAVGIVFSSINSIYRSILAKRLEFKKTFTASLTGIVLSAIVGIYMAYSGYGVWALVTQNVIANIINTIVFAALSGYHPHISFSFSRLRPLISFGWKLMLSSSLTTFYMEVYGLVIGNRYTASDLAYYKKGISFPRLIVGNILASINAVLFPIMVTMNTKAQYKDCVKRFNKLSTFIIMPMMFGLAAIGPSFIRVLLTDKWLSCVTYMQISCISYSLQPIGIGNLQYWKASGRATLYLVADIIKKIIGFSLLAVAVIINKGVVIIAISELISTIIAAIISMIPGRKFIDYSIFEQIVDVLPQFTLSSVMYIAVYVFGRVSNFAYGIELVLQVVIGLIIYLVGAKLLRMREANELLGIVKSMFVGRK